MAIRATSGPGYATGNMSPWDAATGAMPAGGGGGGLNGLLDPNLLRQALLQGLDMKRRGFEEDLAGRQQTRRLAAEEGVRAKKTGEETEKERRRMRREKQVARPYARRAMANEQERDIAQTQALTGRVPTRTSFVTGAGGSQTPDALRMSGAQRMQFLPGEAGLSSAPTRMDLSGIRSDAASDAMIANDRARQRSQRFGTTYTQEDVDAMLEQERNRRRA